MEETKDSTAQAWGWSDVRAHTLELSLFFESLRKVSILKLERLERATVDGIHEFHPAARCVAVVASREA